MKVFYNYNRIIGTEGELNFSPNNRAFKYGDAIFETIRLFKGQPLFFDNHFARIKKSADLLEFDLGNITEVFLKRELIHLSATSGIENGKLRLQLFRDGEGTYIPTINNVKFLAEIFPLESAPFQLNKKGLKIDIFKKHKKEKSFFSNIKSCNSLFYVSAGIFVRKMNLDSCLLINSENQLIEALFSNLFIVKDGQIITPPISSGCIEGTMRINIFNIAQKLNLSVIEKELFEKDIEIADEIFLTNAVKGIEWVGAYKIKRYFNNTARKLSKELISLI